MVESGHSRPMLTLAEYLDLEERSSVRHEFVGGQRIAQAGTSERHNRIAINIVNRLAAALEDDPCRVLMSDVKLRVGDGCASWFCVADP